MTPCQIAIICHETNRAFCAQLGDLSQPCWDGAPEWQKTSAVNGVMFHLANPDAVASHSHDERLKEKAATGWKYGPVKDPDKKEHPCIVPFDQLPPEQQAKDTLFKSVVESLRQLVPVNAAAE